MGFAVASNHLCDRVYAIDIWNDSSPGDKRSIATIEVKAIGKNPATQKMGTGLMALRRVYFPAAN